MHLSVLEAPSIPLLGVWPPSALITNSILLPSLQAGLGVVFHLIMFAIPTPPPLPAPHPPTHPVPESHG